MSRISDSVLARGGNRREEISHRKLVEIGAQLGMEANKIELIANFGPAPEPATVLLPR